MLLHTNPTLFPLQCAAPSSPPPCWGLCFLYRIQTLKDVGPSIPPPESFFSITSCCWWHPGQAPSSPSSLLLRGPRLPPGVCAEYSSHRGNRGRSQHSLPSMGALPLPGSSAVHSSERSVPRGLGQFYVGSSFVTGPVLGASPAPISFNTHFSTARTTPCVGSRSSRNTYS